MNWISRLAHLLGRFGDASHVSNSQHSDDFVQLFVDRLEERRVLSVSAILADGVLSVTGSSGVDNVAIELINDGNDVSSMNEELIRVLDNGVAVEIVGAPLVGPPGPVLEIATSQLIRGDGTSGLLQIDLGDDADTLDLQVPTGASFNPLQTLQIVVSMSSGDDLLTLGDNHRNPLANNVHLQADAEIIRLGDSVFELGSVKLDLTGTLELTSNQVFNSSGDFTLNGNVVGDNVELDVTILGGNLELTGGIGTSLQKLSSVSVDAISIELGGDVFTTGSQNYSGLFSITNDVDLIAGGGVDLDGITGNLFGLNIDSAQSVSITDNVTGLSSLTIDALTEISLHHVSTSGLQSYTANLVTTHSDYLTGGGDFIVTGDWDLHSTSLIETGGGDIDLTRARLFSSNPLTDLLLDSADPISNDAADDGTISLGTFQVPLAVPGAHALRALTIADAGNVIFSANPFEVSGVLKQNSGSGTTVLDGMMNVGAIEITTKNVTVSGDAQIATAGPIKLLAQQNATINSSLETIGVMPPARIDVSANALFISADIQGSGDVSLTSLVAPLIFSGDLDIAAGGGDGTITVTGDVRGNGNPGNRLTWTGTTSISGSILGIAGAEIDRLQVQGGTLTATGIDLSGDLIVAPGSNVETNGGNVKVFGTTTLGGNITALDGQRVTLGQGVFLNQTATLTAENIDITGDIVRGPGAPVGPKVNIILNGTSTLSGQIGMGVDDLIVHGGNVTAHALDLAGDLLIGPGNNVETTGGNVKVFGAALLGGNVTALGQSLTVGQGVLLFQSATLTAENIDITGDIVRGPGAPVGPKVNIILNGTSTLSGQIGMGVDDLIVQGGKLTASELDLSGSLLVEASATGGVQTLINGISVEEDLIAAAVLNSAAAIDILGISSIGADITSQGSQTFGGGVTLTGTTKLMALAPDAAINLPAINGGGFDFTVSTAGTTTLGGNIEQLDHFLVNAGGETVLDAASFSALNSIEILEKVVIEQNAEISALDLVAISGAIEGANAEFNSLNIRSDGGAAVAVAGGQVLIGTHIGAMTALASTDFSAATLLSLHNVSTMGNQDYAAANVVTNSTYVTNGGDFTLTGVWDVQSMTLVDTDGGDIHLGAATLSSSIAGIALTLDATDGLNPGGMVTLGQADNSLGHSLGNVEILGESVNFTSSSFSVESLEVNAAQAITLVGIATSGDQSYAAATLNLEGNYTTEGGSFTIAGAPSQVPPAAVVLTNATTVTTDHGSNLATSDIDLSAAEISAGQANLGLTLDAGTGGDVTILGAGDRQATASFVETVTVRDANMVTLGLNPFTISGTLAIQDLSAVTTSVLMTGALLAGSVSVTGNLSTTNTIQTNIGGATVTGNIHSTRTIQSAAGLHVTGTSEFGDDITAAGIVELDGTVTITDSIAIQGTVIDVTGDILGDGVLPHRLTLDGTTTVSGSIGGAATLGDVISQTGDLQAGSIHISGSLMADNSVMVGELTSAAIHISGNLTATQAVLTTAGDINVGMGLDSQSRINSAGDLFVGGTSQLADDVTSVGDQFYQGAVTINNNVLFTAGDGIDADGNAMTFASTLDSGPFALTSQAAFATNADMLFTGAVGSNRPLDAVLIHSARNVLFSSTVAIDGNLTQLAGTGTTTFNGTSGSGITGSLAITTDNVTFSGNQDVQSGEVQIQVQRTVAFASAGGLNAGNQNIAMSYGVVSGAFVQNEGSTIQTTGNITVLGNGSGNILISDLRAGGSVKLSTTESILDSSFGSELANVTAFQAELIAGTGIGTTFGDLNTRVSQLGFSNDSEQVQITNVGALEIASVGTTTTSQAFGGGFVRAMSPLTISADVMIGGNFSFIAGDSISDNDDLIIAADVTQVNPFGVIEFIAGDDIVHQSGTITNTGGVLNVVRFEADHEAGAFADLERGGITQGANAAIVAGQVRLTAFESVSLNGSLNSISTIAAAVTGLNAGFSLNNTTDLTIGSVALFGQVPFSLDGITTNDGAIILNNGNGTILLGDGAGQDLNAGVAKISINTAGITAGLGSTINASGLQLLGTGTFSLDQANNINVLAADFSGDLLFSNAQVLNVGTVTTAAGTTSGIQSSSGNLTLITTGVGSTLIVGSGTQTEGISTGNGSVTLTSSAELTINDFVNAGANSVLLQSQGTLSQSAGSVITAQQLAAQQSAAVGAIELCGLNAVNEFAAVNVAAGEAIQFHSENNLTIGTNPLAPAILGITSNFGNVEVESAGTLNINNAVRSDNGGPGTGTGDIFLVAAGTVSIDAEVNSSFASMVDTGDLFIHSGGRVDIGAQLTADIIRIVGHGEIGQQGAGDIITAHALGVRQENTLDGFITLDEPLNQVATFAASNAKMVGAITSFTNAQSLTIGTVAEVVAKGKIPAFAETSGIEQNGGFLGLEIVGAGLTIGASGEGIDVGSGDVSLLADDGITEGFGSTITAAQLILTGTGTFTLAQDNLVDALTADVTGELSFRNATGLLVNSVVGIDGIQTHGGDLFLAVTGGGNGLQVGDTIANQNITTMGGNITILAPGQLSIGSGDGQSLIAGGGTVLLNVGGAIENAGSTITATGLELLGTGNFLLGNQNQVGILAAAIVGDLTFVDADELTIGTVDGDDGVALNGSSGITTGVPLTDGGSVSITTGGELTIDEAINTSDGLAGAVSIGSLILNATLTAGAGDITLLGGGQDLIINANQTTVTAASYTARGDVIINATVESTGAAANLTISADVDDNGTGGVLVNSAGEVLATGEILIEGSDLTATNGANELDAVVIAADLNPQVVADETVTIRSRMTSSPVVDADVLIAGAVSSAQGGVFIRANRDVVIGALVITTSSGDLQIIADANGDALGGIHQTASGAINAQGNIHLEGSDLSSSPEVDSVRIDADGTNDQITAVGTLTIQSGLNAPANADLIVNGNLHSTTDDIELDASHTIRLFANLDADAGAVAVHQAVILTGSSTMTAATTANFDSTIDDDGLGGTNSDLVVDAAETTVFSAAIGAVSPIKSLITQGGGVTEINGDINTVGDVNFEDAVILTNSIAVTSLNGSVFFISTVDSEASQAHSLQITAANQIVFDGVVGAGLNGELGSLILDTATNIDLHQNVTTAGDIEITTGVGGTVDIAATVITTNGGSVTITNDGVLTLANSAEFDLTGAFLQVGNGDVVSGASITTAGQDVTFEQAITLSEEITIDSDVGAGDLTFEKDISGPFTLVLTAGLGNIVLSNLGSAAALTGVTVASSVNINLNGNINTTENGNVALTHSGLLTIDNAATLTLGGSFVEDGTGSVSIGADITTTGDSIIFSDAVMLTGSGLVSLDTTGGGLVPTGANIEFQSTLNGEADCDEALSLNAGTAGQILFSGIVGGTELLGALVIVNAGDLTIDQALSVASLTQLNGTGTTTLNADLTIKAVAGVNINTNAIDINANIDADAPGVGAVVQLNAVESISLDGMVLSETGEVTFTAGTTIALNGTIASTGGLLNLLADDDVTFSATTLLDSATGPVTIVADADHDNNGAGGAVTMLDGALVNAGDGTITLSADERITLGGLSTTNDTVNAVRVTSKSADIVDGGDSQIDIVAESANALVTLQAATGIGSADAIDLSVSNVTATNSTSGHIQLLEVAGAAGSLVVTGINHAQGNIDVRTADGDLMIAGAVTTTATGSILLAAEDSGAEGDGNVLVDAQITAVTGQVSIISAANDVHFSAAGDVQTITGNVVVSAGTTTGGSITQETGSLIDAGNATIELNADGPMIVGELLTANSTIAAVTLTTTADVSSADPGLVNVLANSGRLNIASGTGVDTLRTQVESLDVVNFTSGAIIIQEEDAVNVVRIDQQSTVGIADQIEFTTLDGSINIVANASGVQAAAATDITLIAQGTNSDINVADSVTTLGGVITLDAARDLNFLTDGVNPGDDGNLASGGGNIDLTAGGAFTQADMLSIDANGVAFAGTISIQSNGDISIANLTTTNSTASAVSIRSENGSILDNGETDLDIVANSADGIVTLNAETGIGVTAPLGALETNLSNLDATVDGFGGIDITETDDLIILRAVTNDGVINFDVTGNITVNDNGAVGNAVSAGGGETVRLASHADLIVRSEIVTANGSIELLAGNDIRLSNNLTDNGNVNSFGGNITITADADTAGGGGIDQEDGLTINAGSGEIAIQATDDITLANVVTTNAGADALFIQSKSGSLVDGGETDIDLVANAVGVMTTIRTATGVGSTANPLETSLAALDLVNTTSGQVEIRESDSIQLKNVIQNSSGRTDIRSQGTMTIDNGVGVGNAVVSTDVGEVYLEVTGVNENLQVNDGISSTTGQIELIASGTDGDVNILGDITSTGGNVTIIADNSIITTLNDDITTTGQAGANSGDVSLTAETGSIQIASDITTSSNGTENAGKITLQTNGTANIFLTGNLFASGVNASDAGDVTIQTADGSVTLNNVDVTAGGTAGNIFVIAGSTSAAADIILMGTLQATGTIPLTSVDGTVFLDAASEIIDGNDGSTLISTGDLSLTAGENIGEITDFVARTGNAINAEVSGLLQDLSIAQAGGEIHLQVIGDLQAATGAVVPDADGAATLLLQTTGALDVGSNPGVLELSTGDFIGLHAGTVLILPDAGMSVGSGATGGTLRLSGGTDVVDPAGRELGKLTAHDLFFISNSAGGQTTLNVDVTNLDVDLSGSPSSTMLTINNDGALNADSIVTNQGDLLINNGAELNIGTIRTTGGEVRINNSLVAGGDITIDLIDAATGNVILDTTSNGGQLRDLNGATTNIISAGLAMRTSNIAGVDIVDETLEVQVDTLAADANNLGVKIFDETGNLEIGTVDGFSGITVTNAAADDVIEVVTVGTLNVNDDVISTGLADICLASFGNGEDNDVNIDADIRKNGTAGQIRIIAGDDVTLTGTSEVSVENDLNVTLQAGVDIQGPDCGGLFTTGNLAADILMADGSVIGTDAGLITLQATRDVAMSIVNANLDSDELFGNVVVTADDNGIGGFVPDNVGEIGETLSPTAATGEAANVIADDLSLSAATGIGSVDDLELNVNSVDATNRTSGNIQLFEIVGTGDNPLTVNLVSNLLGNIDVQTADGDLTIAGPISTTNAGTVNLVAGDDDLDGNGDLLIQSAITSVDGSVTLTSEGNDVEFTADGDVTTTRGRVDVLAGETDDAGTIRQAASGVVNAGSAEVVFTAHGEITLGQIITTNTSDHAVTLNADAGVQSADPGNVLNIDAAAGRLMIHTVTGVEPILTTVDSLDLTNMTSGGVTITETDALDLVRVDQNGTTTSIPAGIDLTSGGTLTLLVNEAGVTGTDSPVNLTTTGAGSELVINSTVQSTTGKITLNAADDLRMGAVSTIQTDATELLVIAGDALNPSSSTTGGIFMADGAVITAQQGRVDLVAKEEIQVGRIVATENDNEVRLTSIEAAITDAGDAGGEDIDTHRLGLSAVQGIGSGDALETSVDFIAAANTTSGGIEIDNTTDSLLTIGDFNSTDLDVTLGVLSGINLAGNTAESITLTQGGALRVGSPVINTTGGAIELTSGGDMTIDARVVAEIGSPQGIVRLTAGADLIVNDTNPGQAAVADIEGFQVIGSAGTAVPVIDRGTNADLYDPSNPDIFNPPTVENPDHFNSDDPNDLNLLPVRFAPNVLVKSSTGSITQPVPSLGNISTPQVLATGISRITGDFGRELENSFRYLIDWDSIFGNVGDDLRSGEPLFDNETAGFVGVVPGVGPGGFDFDHLFLSNPDPNNPSAPILITLQLVDDANISFFGSGGAVDLGAITMSSSATVPGEGLAGGIAFDVSIDIPPIEAPRTQFTDAFQLNEGEVANEEATELLEGVVDSEAVRDELILIIQKVGPDGKVEKDQFGRPIQRTLYGGDALERLSDLPELHQRLDFGHWKIFTKEGDDGQMMLVEDVILRDGRPVVGEEGTQDRPPTSENAAEMPPTKPVTENDGTSAAQPEQIQDPPSDPEVSQRDMNALEEFARFAMLPVSAGSLGRMAKKLGKVKHLAGIMIGFLR